MNSPANLRPDPPSEAEAAVARESGQRLAAFTDCDLHLRAGEPGQEVHVELPARAVALLVELLNELADGNAVSVVALSAELTTQQAANLLGVSRPFLIKELERGAIPFRKVGKHRRVRNADLLAYEERNAAERRRALDELAELGQELDPEY